MNRFFKIVQWLLVIAALGAMYFFHSANKDKDIELATLRPQAEEVAQLKTENTELQKLPWQSDEIARLKKANADLLKLRNEARRLRDEKKQMASQLKATQLKAEEMQARVNEREWNLARERDELAEKQKFLALNEYTATPQGQAALNTAFCINNLRQLDGAKQQWALENKKTEKAVPTATDVAAYLKDGIIPKCQAGGVYSLNSVADNPTCSIPGHKLPAR